MNFKKKISTSLKDIGKCDQSLVILHKMNTVHYTQNLKSHGEIVFSWGGNICDTLGCGRRQTDRQNCYRASAWLC